MKTLITPAQVLRLAFADAAYVAPGSITELDIASVEQRHIVPLVGQALYDKLLAGAYTPLRNEYLATASALLTRVAMQPRLNVRTDAAGTAVPKSQGAQPAGEAALRELQKSLRHQARGLLRRASEYLQAHAQQFPEYDPHRDILNRCSTDGGLVQVL